jgi:hypothetical protein
MQRSIRNCKKIIVFINLVQLLVGILATKLQASKRKKINKKKKKEYKSIQYAFKNYLPVLISARTGQSAFFRSSLSQGGDKNGSGINLT